MVKAFKSGKSLTFTAENENARPEDSHCTVGAWLFESCGPGSGALSHAASVPH